MWIVRFCLLLVAALLRSAESGQIVRRNIVVEVRNGRSVELSKDNLAFNVNPREICKVEVVTNEPLYQRVGLFKPEVGFLVWHLMPNNMPLIFHPSCPHC